MMTHLHDMHLSLPASHQLLPPYTMPLLVLCMHKSNSQEMAEHVREVDPNHLVTSGSEGFFGEGDPNVSKNPQPWAKQTGQNFVDDNRHMDFAVTHAWPDNWFM
jgi:hypothetical protein